MGYGNPPPGYGMPPPGPVPYGYGAPMPPNPYAMYGGPQFHFAAPQTAPNLWIKWLYLGAVVLSGSLLAIAFGIDQALEDWATYSTVDHKLRHLREYATMGCGIFWLATFILGLMWLGLAWGNVPPEHRMVTPGEAIGKMFIPGFNLYWIFRASTGLCTAFDYALASRGSLARAPKGLAIAASIVTVIPYLNFGLAPFMWLLFIFACDITKKEVWDRTAGQPPPAAVPT
jgi:hypothetical protein